MTHEEFRREKQFFVAILLLRRMISQGIITPAEYQPVRNLLLEKYHPVAGELLT